MRSSLKTFGLVIGMICLVAVMVLLTLQLVRSQAQDLTDPPAVLREPITKEVSAALGWQNTGILLQSGETIHIQFLSGEIRDGETIIRGPAGVGWACGDNNCCEPMPTMDRDALIGRVGGALFLIGDTTDIAISRSGELQLRINDCDAGLFDNSGSLKIKISP